MRGLNEIKDFFNIKQKIKLRFKGQGLTLDEALQVANSKYSAWENQHENKIQVTNKTIRYDHVNSLLLNCYISCYYQKP
jgi:hypothetical protein